MSAPASPSSAKKQRVTVAITDELRGLLGLSTMEVVADIATADISDVWLVLKTQKKIMIADNDRRPLKGPIFHNEKYLIRGQDITDDIDVEHCAEGRGNAERVGRLNFVELMQRETWTKEDQKTVEGLSPQEVFLAKVGKAAREELYSIVHGTIEVAFCIRRKGSSKCKAIVVLDASQLESKQAYLDIRNETNISSPVKVKFRQGFDPIKLGIHSERWSCKDGIWFYKNPYRENNFGHHTFMPLDDACAKVHGYLMQVANAKREHSELSLKMYADHCIIDLQDQFRKHI